MFWTVSIKKKENIVIGETIIILCYHLFPISLMHMDILDLARIFKYKKIF